MPLIDAYQKNIEQEAAEESASERSMPCGPVCSPQCAPACNQGIVLLPTIDAPKSYNELECSANVLLCLTS